MKGIVVTLPSIQELFGNSFLHIGQLDFFKNENCRSCGVKATGLACKYGDSIIHSSYWTRTINKFKQVGVICFGYGAPEGDDGLFFTVFANYTSDTYIRPMLKLPSKLFNKIIKKAKNTKYGERVRFGEYPQDVPDAFEQRKLDVAFKDDKMLPTGRNYFINGNECPEYFLDGKRYIRLINPILVSVYFWAEVSPVKWYIDRKNNYLISEKCLLAGVNYSDTFLETFKFEDTNMYKFLNEVMLKDLFQKKIPVEKAIYVTAVANIPKISNNDIDSFEEKLLDDSLSADELKQLKDALLLEKSNYGDFVKKGRVK